MHVVLGYLRGYFESVDKPLLTFCGVWVSVLIVLNYQLGIEHVLIASLGSRFYQFWALFGIYCSAFIVPYLFIIVFRKHLIAVEPALAGLLLIAPALFALKVSIINPLSYGVTGAWGKYWVDVTVLPFKFLVVLAILAALFRVLPAQSSFWGVTLRNLNWRSYGLMLAAMVPLIAYASTQADFLSAYPRAKQIAAYVASDVDYGWLAVLLYEIGYGIDFVTIELFFRGFLVFAFVRYAGASVILPMAVFYCSIHFGKPLMECISSFFGGLILGVIAYQTRSIVGGLAVHLGIAWMMEVGGYIGNMK